MSGGGTDDVSECFDVWIQGVTRGVVYFRRVILVGISSDELYHSRRLRARVLSWTLVCMVN